ncbi:MAG: AbrB/MazE/SpoVT family DNA-binding domain-containing protein [Propylenella sp.]
MRTSLKKMGNSSGVIIPKPILAEVGIAPGDAMEMVVESGRIVLAPIRSHPRAGWAEASRALAARGEDGLVWPEFGNDDDKDLGW